MALVDNLVAYYKLDESSGNPADSSGNSYSLTNTGTATFGAGKINNGTILNGSSQYHDTTQAAFNITGSFSINAWIKLDTSATQDIISNVVTDSNTYGPLYKISTDSSSVIKAQTWASSGSFLDISSGVTASTGTWYMVTFVKAADDDWRLYVNAGTPATSSSSRTLSVTGKDGFRIGAGEGTVGSRVPSSFFDGMVDECAVWTRALTGTEITELYNSGNGSQYPFSQAITMITETGSYILTGIDTTFKKAWKLITEKGTYILTGVNISLHIGLKYILSVITGAFTYTGMLAWKYIFDAKKTNTYSYDDSSTDTYINDNRTVSTYTNDQKPL